jgi:hypothetical protein
MTLRAAFKSCLSKSISDGVSLRGLLEVTSFRPGKSIEVESEGCLLNASIDHLYLVLMLIVHTGVEPVEGCMTFGTIGAVPPGHGDSGRATLHPRCPLSFYKAEAKAIARQKGERIQWSG